LFKGILDFGRGSIYNLVEKGARGNPEETAELD
jgi:hypothetical protein